MRRHATRAARQAELDEAVTRFGRTAREYRDLIDSLAGGRPPHLREKLMRVLLRMLVEVHGIEGWGPLEEAGVDRSAEWNRLRPILAGVLKPDMEEAAQAAGDEADRNRALSLWDDLAGIYSDMACA